MVNLISILIAISLFMSPIGSGIIPFVSTSVSSYKSVTDTVEKINEQKRQEELDAEAQKQQEEAEYKKLHTYGKYKRKELKSYGFVFIPATHFNIDSNTVKNEFEYKYIDDSSYVKIYFTTGLNKESLDNLATEKLGYVDNFVTEELTVGDNTYTRYIDSKLNEIVLNQNSNNEVDSEVENKLDDIIVDDTTKNQDSTEENSTENNTELNSDVQSEQDLSEIEEPKYNRVTWCLKSINSVLVIDGYIDKNTDAVPFIESIESALDKTIVYYVSQTVFKDPSR